MQKASASNPAPVPNQRSLTTRTTWWTLLVCISALPLTTAILAPGSQQGWAFISDAYHLPKLLILSVLMSVATISWLAEVIFFERTLRTSAALVPLAVFALLAIISTAFAPEAVGSLFGASLLATGTVTWLMCAWLSVLASQFLTSGTRLNEVSWALIGGCTAVGAVALLQAAGLDPLSVPVPEGAGWMVRQGSSTLGNPDYTGLLLIVPTALAVSLAISERVDWRRWTAIACGAVMAGALFVTLTRAAWLGAAVALTMVVILAPSGTGVKKRIGLSIGVGALGMATIAFFFLGYTAVRDRFALLTGGGLDSFTSGRVTLWGDALRIMAKHPLLGTGADRLALGGYEVQRTLIIEDAARYVLQDPHNAFLLVGGTFGIPAVLAILTFAAFVIHAGWLTLRTNTSQSRANLLYIGWFAGLAGLSVAAVFSVWTISAVFILFLTLGVVVSPKLRTSESPHRMAYAITLGCLGLVLTGTSLYGTVSMFSAERHVAQSRYADSKMHLESAIRLAPWDTGIRIDYYSRKIGASKPILQGQDAAAAAATAAALDTELKFEIVRFRRELLFYRLRIYLYQVSEDAPGYQRDKHLEALDAALRVFPGDPEFSSQREKLLASQS